jgi:hypothetical protein
MQIEISMANNKDRQLASNPWDFGWCSTSWAPPPPSHPKNGNLWCTVSHIFLLQTGNPMCTRKWKTKALRFFRILVAHVSTLRRVLFRCLNTKNTMSSFPCLNNVTPDPTQTTCLPTYFGPRSLVPKACLYEQWFSVCSEMRNAMRHTVRIRSNLAILHCATRSDTKITVCVNRPLTPMTLPMYNFYRPVSAVE